MKLDKEFAVKHSFWLLLSGAGILWLPVFFVSCAGMSSAKQKELFDKRKTELSQLKGFHTQAHIDALDKKKGAMETLKQDAWAREWKKQQDNDADNSYWNQGSNGLFWFDAMNKWTLPTQKAIDEKIKGPDGILAKMTAGNMDGDIDYAFLKNWGRGFYELEVQEVQGLVAPAFLKTRKGVLVCDEYDDNIIDGKDDTTKEEAWLLQEDLVVRRDVFRLLRRVAENTHKLRSVGLFHKVPYTTPVDTYESANWHLELVSGSGEAKGSKVSPPPEASESARTLSFGPASRLSNIRPDQQPAALKNLQLRFWQGPQGSTHAKDFRVDLNLPDKKLAHKEQVEFKDLGVKSPIVLKDFDATRPIEISLVNAEETDTAPKDGARKTVVLSNANWQVELVLEKKDSAWYLSNESKLTNVQGARRKILLYNLGLAIGTGKKEAQVISLQGDAVTWNSTRPFKDLGMTDPLRLNFDLDRLDFDHDVYVSQVPAWDSAPVKRIDFIGVGVNSHLTAAADLVTRKNREINPSGKTALPSSSSSSSDSPAAEGSDSESEALIVPYWRIEHRRYLVSTNQLRVLPVAIVAVIDQAQLEEVLAAFEPSNSRLNFVKTMVTWKHVPAVQPENSAPRFPINPKVLGSGSLPFTPFFPGGAPPIPPTGRRPPGGIYVDGAEGAMIEVTIYGLVKLFEPTSKKAASSGRSGSNP